MEKQIIYANDYYQVFLDNRDILSLKNLKNGAAILPMTKNKKVILMEIFRKPVNEYSLEVPRGFKEEKEDSIETAKRELYEEITCECKEILSLGSMYPDSGFIDSKIDLYLGFGANLIGNKLQEEEGIHKLKLVDYDKAIHMAIEGEILDSYTLAALLRSQKYLK